MIKFIMAILCVFGSLVAIKNNSCAGISLMILICYLHSREGKL